jgi:hypothetical protein
MSGLIHGWPIFFVFVENACILFLRFQCQDNRFGFIVDVMTGVNWCYRCIPGIERVEEGRAWAENMDKGEAFMFNSLLDKRGQIFWLGRVSSCDEADV